MGGGVTGGEKVTFTVKYPQLPVVLILIRGIPGDGRVSSSGGGG